uniref:Organic cation transporter 1 n=1 Tax=Romanomermis culicivorax TaxID=13658 RepID=A0A915ID94_ROMCU
MDLEFDDILSKVGDFGSYQLIMYFIICLPASIPSAWTAFNQVFVAAVPAHRCKNNTNYSSALESSSTNILYKRCDESFILPSKIYQDNGSSSLAVNVTIVECREFEFDKSVYETMELIGPSRRIFAGMVVCIIFGLAMCALGFIASLIRSWSIITFVSNAPFAVLFIYWWILPESPRWLITEGKIDQAYKHLLKIAKFNKIVVDPSEIRRDCETLYYCTTCNKQGESKHNMTDLVQTRNMRMRFILISFIWFVNAVVYNGLTFNISNLEVDDYVSFMINGAVEVPAYLTTWVFLDKMGRRWSLFISMLIGGVACISTIFVPMHEKWVISGLAFLGKFGIAASFGIIYIFAGELYPTVVRAMGMGMSSMIAGIGLLLAPYLVSLGLYHRILPLLIMGAFTIMAGLLSLFLPETTDAPLLQSIEEAERFKSTRNLFSLKSEKRKLTRFQKVDVIDDEDDFELKKLARKPCPMIIIDED